MDAAGGRVTAVAGSRVLGGRYVLAEVLGTGGMAAVWRANDQVLGREVAVKVLSQQFAADPGFAARFEREARHAASVSHPRLVTVFDSGIDRGAPFLVMELVTGRTLRQVLDETGPLPAGQAIAIAAGVCEGLEAAHSAGLVHRDIKPANIMLAGGEVKILDFGIARADGAAAGTTAGRVLGTPAYLSPEQAAGHPAGPASDLYSLGCVLFEMLTGSPPFTAESQLALAYRQVYDDPGPPSARCPGLPASLDQLTAWLLAKAPAGRPASAAAARAGLLAVPTQGGTALPQPPPPEPPAPGSPARTPGSRQRLRWPEILLTAALTAALAALATVLLVGRGSAGPAGPALAAAGTTAHTPAATRLATSTRTAAATSTRTSAAARPATSTRASVSRPPNSAAPRSAPAHTATAPALPPTATAAAALVGDLQAGVADGQVAQQAGQDLFSHLQPLLFGPPGSDAQQTQNQFTQLVQAYDKHQSQGQITGKAATIVPKAIAALGAALGVH